MHEIHVLWVTPRTTSTAFEWMMRMRKDMNCFHEPFGEVWYKGDEAAWPRMTADSQRIPGLTFQVVIDRMKRAAEERPVFSKDMPHYVLHLADPEFLSLFNHTFLIRDPAKAVPSILSRAPDMYDSEFGFVEHRQLFDRVHEFLGEPPPVIDSDDLLENPHGIVERWCNAIDIPFMPEALSWEPGARDEVSWYEDGSWHDKLRNSDGLKPQPRTYAKLEDASDRAKEVYSQALPHYQHLHQHRLRV